MRIVCEKSFYTAGDPCVKFSGFIPEKTFHVPQIKIIQDPFEIQTAKEMISPCSLNKMTQIS